MCRRPPPTLSSGAIIAPEPNALPAPAPLPAPSAHGHTRKGAKGAAGRVKEGKWEVGVSAGELSERTLVRELLFVMQGIDGLHLQWDRLKDSYALPPGAKLPPGGRQLVGRLSELGWLFRHVSAYVKAGATAAGGSTSAAGGREGSVVAEGGLVAQALRHALGGELDEWYQLIAVLEEQRRSELTLLQLLVWSAEPMQRLLLMAQLTRGEDQRAHARARTSAHARILPVPVRPVATCAHVPGPDLCLQWVCVSRGEAVGICAEER